VTSSVLNLQSQFLNLAKDGILDVANFALYTIVTNTNKGKNANNKPFFGYSQTYLKLRAKRGLGSTPNMQWSSAMIQSVQVDKSRLRNLILTIKPTGASGGIGNSTKMAKLEAMKNYIIVSETPYLQKLISDRFQKFITSRWRNI
jgi:hypothetical protein